MSRHIYDAGAVVVPRTSITSNTTFPAVAFPGLWDLAPSALVLQIEALSAAGVSTLLLEAASTVAGPWFEVGRATVPQTFPTPSQVSLGLGGQALVGESGLPRPGALRLTVNQTGPASMTLTAWLSKALSGPVGQAVGAGAMLTPI